jgi:hypothetical protein
MATKLNLAKHAIGHQPNSKKLWTAGDIEVHVGSVCILWGEGRERELRGGGQGEGRERRERGGRWKKLRKLFLQGDHVAGKGEGRGREGRRRTGRGAEGGWRVGGLEGWRGGRVDGEDGGVRILHLNFIYFQISG